MGAGSCLGCGRRFSDWDRGSHGDRYWPSLFIAIRNTAFAFKNRPWLKHQARGIDIRRYDRITAYLDGPARLYGAGEAALDEDALSEDLPLDDGMLPENQRFVGDERALCSRVDAERARSFQLPLKDNAPLKKPSPFASVVFFPFRPGPSHTISRGLFSHELIVEAGEIARFVILKN